jgi:hypothetical protein
MRALVLISALLVPAFALAQPIAPNCSSPSTACKASKFSLVAGKLLCLNSTTCSDTIKADSTTAGMVFNSGVANSGTNVAYVLSTTNLLSGTTQLFSVRNQGTDKAYIDKDGWITGAGFGIVNGIPFGQGFTFSGSNSSVVSGGDAFLVGFSSQSGLSYGSAAAGGFWANGSNSTGDPVPSVHGAQTHSAQAMEFSSATASAGGALAVSFATAFASAPVCTCADQNAAPVSCGISTTATTSGVTFTIGSARADTVKWICVGAR